MNRLAEWFECIGRRAAEEIHIVSGSSAVFLTMMSSDDVKRVCRDRLDDLTQLRKESEKDRSAISKPELTKWLSSRVLSFKLH